MKIKGIAAALVAATVTLSAAPASARHHHASQSSEPADPVSQKPEAPPAMVTLTPAPGVTFQIPQNWIACDDATEKLLTSAHDPLSLHDKICNADPGVPVQLRAFDPRPFRNVSILFNHFDHQVLSSDALNAFTPDDMKAGNSAMCDAATKALKETTKIASCNAGLGLLATKRAIVVAIVEIVPAQDVPNPKILVTSYELPYSQGYLQLQISYPEMFQQNVLPEVNAVLNSVQIQ